MTPSYFATPSCPLFPYLLLLVKLSVIRQVSKLWTRKYTKPVFRAEIAVRTLNYTHRFQIFHWQSNIKKLISPCLQLTISQNHYCNSSWISSRTLLYSFNGIKYLHKHKVDYSLRIDSRVLPHLEYFMIPKCSCYIRQIVVMHFNGAPLSGLPIQLKCSIYCRQFKKPTLFFISPFSTLLRYIYSTIWILKPTVMVFQRMTAKSKTPLL